ncbi:hypothetical protein DMX02_08570 [Pseudomonas jessenii]|nr:hypothetical protein DMX02_08570 [Pseudomonas jessenii]
MSGPRQKTLGHSRYQLRRRSPHACELLASANVLDQLEATSRNLLVIAQIIMLCELALNCALNQLDSKIRLG